MTAGRLLLPIMCETAFVEIIMRAWVVDFGALYRILCAPLNIQPVRCAPILKAIAY